MFAAITNFSNSLYRTVIDEQGNRPINTFFAPTSIYIGMMATMLGSEGETKRQIFEGLNLNDNVPEADNADLLSKQLAKLLRPISRCISGSKAETVEISGTNMAFFRQSIPINLNYVKEIERLYGFQSEFLAFDQYTERDREQINSWIAQRMNGTVPQLMPPGSINEDSKFILVNGLGFKGAWAKTFNDVETKQSIFHLLDGSRKSVNMMYQFSKFAVQEIPGARARALKIYFRDLNWSMIFILPNEANGLMDALIYIRQPKRLAEIIGGDFKTREVHFTLPRFKLYQGHGMNCAKKLTELQISNPFCPSKAELPGIAEGAAICLSQIRHKAVIYIHEDGVSEDCNSVFMGEHPRGANPRCEFTCDHPFILSIVAQDQVPIFIGHVVDPEVI